MASALSRGGAKFLSLEVIYSWPELHELSLGQWPRRIRSDPLSDQVVGVFTRLVNARGVYII